MKAASQAWAPLFLYVFTLGIVLLVLNTFIAILMEFYENATEEIKESEEVMETIMRRTHQVVEGGVS